MEGMQAARAALAWFGAIGEPHSPAREGVKYALVAAGGVLVATRRDVIGDDVGALGWLDDLGYFVLAVAAWRSALRDRGVRRARREAERMVQQRLVGFKTDGDDPSQSGVWLFTEGKR